MTLGIVTQLIISRASHPMQKAAVIMAIKMGAEVILEAAEVQAVVVILEEEVVIAAVVVTEPRVFVSLAAVVRGD